MSSFRHWPAIQKMRLTAPPPHESDWRRSIVDNWRRSRLVRDTNDYSVFWTVIQKRVQQQHLQDGKMREMLDNHLEEVTEQVESVTRKIVQKITDEDQYHIVHQEFFEAIERKVQARVDQVSGQELPALQDCMSNLESQVSVLKWISGISLLTALSLSVIVIRR